jgi:hypothetical protein
MSSPVLFTQKKLLCFAAEELLSYVLKYEKCM